MPVTLVRLVCISIRVMPHGSLDIKFQTLEFYLSIAPLINWPLSAFLFVYLKRRFEKGRFKLLTVSLFMCHNSVSNS